MEEKELKFTSEELEELRNYYREELRMLIKKIEKTRMMLEKLGVPSNIDVSVYKKSLIPNEIYAKQIIIKPEKKEYKKIEQDKEKINITKQKMLTKWDEIEERSKTDPLVKEFFDIMNDENIPVIEIATNKKKKSKNTEPEILTQIVPSKYKRAKNILWSDYVYDKLSLIGYPLTVNELKEYALAELELSEKEKESAFSAIHSALFRLKRNQKSINNYAIKGSRTCYYGLAEWFTKEGKLFKKHSRPI